MSKSHISVQIKKADQQNLWVIANHANCQTCEQSKHCIQLQTQRNKPALRLPIKSDLQTEQALTLSIANNKLTQASLLVYGLPLSSMLLAAILGQNLKNDGLTLICMLIGLTIGFLLARFLQANCITSADISLHNSLTSNLDKELM